MHNLCTVLLRYVLLVPKNRKYLSRGDIVPMFLDFYVIISEMIFLKQPTGSKKLRRGIMQYVLPFDLTVETSSEYIVWRY